MTKVILGLPYLSNGPLLAKAKELQAPVLVSANCFSKWIDEGPAPLGYEFSREERHDYLVHGITPPTLRGRPERMRRWDGWNLAPLKNADGLPELWLDSAGFVAMEKYGWFPWTPEAYIFGLCAAYPWTRFSALDCCVEEEVAGSRFMVEERVSKTIALNYTCQRLADEAGIGDRLMPIIQGDTVDDYLRCFEAIEPLAMRHGLIGVGSMCRRKVGGPLGIVEIVDALDRRLPKEVKLHLFGLKSDGGEAVTTLGDRVYSIDSQAYGFRARMIAQEKRAIDPTFSKSNAFVAEVMANWYQGQVARMANPKPKPVQNSLMLDFGGDAGRAARDPWYALEARARAEMNELIESGDMDPEDIISDAKVIAWMSMIADDEEPESDAGDAPLPMAA
jgi:hypothetical protein